jgi:hypothetical protein
MIAFGGSPSGRRKEKGKKEDEGGSVFFFFSFCLPPKAALRGKLISPPGFPHRCISVLQSRKK